MEPLYFGLARVRFAGAHEEESTNDGRLRRQLRLEEGRKGSLGIGVEAQKTLKDELTNVWHNRVGLCGCVSGNRSPTPVGKQD